MRVASVGLLGRDALRRASVSRACIASESAAVSAVVTRVISAACCAATRANSTACCAATRSELLFVLPRLSLLSLLRQKRIRDACHFSGLLCCDAIESHFTVPPVSRASPLRSLAVSRRVRVALALPRISGERRQSREIDRQPHHGPDDGYASSALPREAPRANPHRDRVPPPFRRVSNQSRINSLLSPPSSRFT